MTPQFIQFHPYIFDRTFDVRIFVDRNIRITQIGYFGERQSVDELKIYRACLFLNSIAAANVTIENGLHKVLETLETIKGFETEAQILSSIVAYDKWELSVYRWRAAEKMSEAAK